MKIKMTWKAIQSFFKMDPASLDAQELTDKRVQQINDQLATVTARNEELENLLTAESAAKETAISDLETLRWRMPEKKPLQLRQRIKSLAPTTTRSLPMTRSPMNTAHKPK